MKRTIDMALLSLERAISSLQIFAEECKDSEFHHDIWTFHALVFHHKNLVRIYYHHWCSEFTDSERVRMFRLLSFDESKFVEDYLYKYHHDFPVSYSDDLPF